jgi:hypothetical protein
VLAELAALIDGRPDRRAEPQYVRSEPDGAACPASA